MPDLIAQGLEPQQRWRRTLPEGQAVVIGRAGGPWAVPWDLHASRRHARLQWTGDRLEVARLPEARNPVFFYGDEVDTCVLKPGEHFVIGETSFTLADQRANITTDLPEPVQQQSFSAQYLRQVPFHHPDYRIEVLSRLPEVISGAAGDAELFVRLVSMLLAGVPGADAAAVVAVKPVGEIADMAEPEGESNSHHAEVLFGERPQVAVLHWDQRLAIANDFQPSQGLILEALRQRQTVLHVWRGAEMSHSPAFTESETFDWAFCTPVLGKVGVGWALYVAGRFNADRVGVGRSSDPSDLREDVKFTELVAAMLSSLRQMRLLERASCHA